MKYTKNVYRSKLTDEHLKSLLIIGTSKISPQLQTIEFSSMSPRAGQNLSAGRMWPSGRSLETPVLDEWPGQRPDFTRSFKHPNSEIICHADDVSIILWNKSFEEFKKLSEYNLCYVIQWCNMNKLSISPEKTNLFYLHNKPKVPIEIPNIILNPIDQVEILGINFSNHRIKKINFTPHINDILCKP
ncbi:EPM2AIP1 [Cordylochernes scorpioides]|uniref:EPM2AIP1 n=1 Tax=Cordylochernes scorpioides TaxID=51811 RepID=A0ABY6LE62_9ARAC|nr:EPM2AIP1 [Cordylochernes scorpioides]